jgi:hypothetical protein
MKTILIKLIILTLLLSVVSCSKKAKEDETTSTTSSDEPIVEPEPDCIEPGDIIVSNSGSDVVLVLNPDGSYKDIAFNVPNISETIGGIYWDDLDQKLFVAVDGADRIVEVDPVDCSSTTRISDGNLTGTMKGLSRDVNGDFYIVETSNVEKFNSDGMRITTGGWPKSLQTLGTGIDFFNGSTDFVHCSTTTDVVRTYNSAGTQIATKSSGIATTTDAMDCMILANGNIAVSWSGTTDTLAIYSSDLATTIATYSNISILSSPGGIAERDNGNLLIVDRLLHFIIEVEADGTYVGILGDGVLNTPEFITVVPE